MPQLRTAILVRKFWTEVNFQTFKLLITFKFFDPYVKISCFNGKDKCTNRACLKINPACHKILYLEEDCSCSES